jgi:hypothetical protein
MFQQECLSLFKNKPSPGIKKFRHSFPSISPPCQVGRLMFQSLARILSNPCQICLLYLPVSFSTLVTPTLAAISFCESYVFFFLLMVDRSFLKTLISSFKEVASRIAASLSSYLPRASLSGDNASASTFGLIFTLDHHALS